GEKLSGEMLKVSVQLHAFDGERRLVAEDAEKGDRIVAGVALAVDIEDALRFCGDEERYADRKGNILCIGRSKLLRRRAFDDQRLAPFERLPGDRRPDRDARSDETPRTRRADDERIAGGVDGHERRRLVGDRLVSGFEHEVEQLVGTRGVPDAPGRAREPGFISESIPLSICDSMKAPPVATWRIASMRSSFDTSFRRYPAAPARTASRRYAGLSCIVTMITAVRDRSSLMRRVASSPSMSGMRTSMSTTSGSSLRAVSIASRPVLA